MGSEKISSAMSRDRWEDIRVNLLPTDPNDKLSKMRPLLVHPRSKFIEMTKYLCVDEQMVPFKGNSSLKQHIPKKPHKRGFIVLADDMGLVMMSCHLLVK